METQLLHTIQQQMQIIEREIETPKAVKVKSKPYLISHHPPGPSANQKQLRKALRNIRSVTI